MKSIINAAFVLLFNIMGPLAVSSQDCYPHRFEMAVSGGEDEMSGGEPDPISPQIIWEARNKLTGCSGLNDCLWSAAEVEDEVICAAYFLGRKLGSVEAEEQFEFNTVTEAKSIRG
eukprot:scaffold41757_cov47-Cyclotella_meneghiniana.AAC.3